MRTGKRKVVKTIPRASGRIDAHMFAICGMRMIDVKDTRTILPRFKKSYRSGYLLLSYALSILIIKKYLSKRTAYVLSYKDIYF